MKDMRGIILLIVLTIFSIGNSFFAVNQYNELFIYFINPLFWFFMVIYSLSYILNIFKARIKYRSFLINLMTLAGLAYVIIHFGLGAIIADFGENPTKNTMEGIFNNFWVIGLIIVFREIIRSVLVIKYNIINKGLYYYLFIFAFTLMSINFLGISSSFSDVFGIVKFIGASLIPLLVLNVVLTNTAYHGGPIPGIIYLLIVNVYTWVFPIMPKFDWIIIAFLSTIIPFLALLRLDNYVLKKEQSASHSDLEETDTLTWTLRFGVIIITILFFLGITPIYPINIVTNSMYPNIHVGDVVLVEKVNIKEIEVGDIVQYKKESYSIIHRVIEIDEKDGIIKLYTKGDNNNNVDSTITTYQNLLGKVVLRVPKLGLPNVWFRKLFNSIDEENATDN